MRDGQRGQEVERRVDGVLAPSLVKPGRQARSHQEHEDAAERVEYKHHGVERVHDFLRAPQRLLVVGARVVEERVPAMLRNKSGLIFGSRFFLNGPVREVPHATGGDAERSHRFVDEEGGDGGDGDLDEGAGVQGNHLLVERSPPVVDGDAVQDQDEDEVK